MKRKEKILLTIAARGGSKGVKNKNIRNLCGLPLIAHTINQAKRWNKADALICSTDSKAIAEVARHYGAQTPFLRPPSLATDKAGKLGVLRHALETMEKITGEQFDILIDLDATSPIRNVNDIEQCLRLFKRFRPDSVVTVTHCRRNPYFNMLERGADKYVHVVKKLGKSIQRRQDAPQVFDMNASIYVYDRNYLLNDKTRVSVSSRTLAWEMSPYSMFDIDTEEDFRFIEFLVSKKLVSL